MHMVALQSPHKNVAYMHTKVWLDCQRKGYCTVYNFSYLLYKGVELFETTKMAKKGIL